MRNIKFLLAVVCLTIAFLYKQKDRGSNDGRLNISFLEKRKINQVCSKYKECVFGIDLSHYQGVLAWDSISHLNDSIPITFVYLRATMGSNTNDKYFKDNYLQAKKNNLKVGAYHYYRPNENSLLQANNFISHVKLTKGDLPPVLDIEALPTQQSMSDLRIGLKKWLLVIEKHYGIKPIIYSGDSFYKDHLLEHQFKDYKVWIANFNDVKAPMINNWHIWQFTENGLVKGVDEKVDFNVLNGNLATLDAMCLK